MNMLLAAARGQRIDYIYDMAAANDTLELIVPRKQSAIALEGMVAGMCRYLQRTAKQAATVGTPYVAVDSRIAPLDFTASMRITGARRGVVHLMVSRAMLTIMLMRMGSQDITTEHMTQVLRDMAQAAVVEARADNSDVLVWSPTVRADRHGIELPREARPLIVPIQWRKFTAQWVVCVA